VEVLLGAVERQAGAGEAPQFQVVEDGVDKAALLLERELCNRDGMILINRSQSSNLLRVLTQGENTSMSDHSTGRIHPDHLILNRVPNLGQLTPRWEINKFENC
jgi:hypothetical protein